MARGAVVLALPRGGRYHATQRAGATRNRNNARRPRASPSPYFGPAPYILPGPFGRPWGAALCARMNVGAPSRRPATARLRPPGWWLCVASARRTRGADCPWWLCVMLMYACR
ncbi:unnamed protein product [Amoebophrya sp. A120]|nr:unnamed protein product [Amoebophrya sp. A120]|eukprot:GSA120T00014334001.1